MISSLDPTAQIFLAGVNNIQQRIATANQQITSSKKINVASDSPDQIDGLLQLRANQAQNTQIQSNLNLEQTNAQSADGALSSAILLMDNAIQVAAQGAPSTQTADQRASLAQQIATIQQQMVSISQTQVQGRYIFSGDQDQSPSYQADLSAPNGVTQLSNAASTRQVQDPQGGTFSGSQTAQQIFDSRNPDGTNATNNVFAALNSLRVALLSNDQDGITAAQNGLKAASTHLNDAQSFYGNVETRLQNASSYASKYDTQLTIEIGNIQDADVAAAALQLTAANTQLQAAFQARAQMPHSSLFDFLG